MSSDLLTGRRQPACPVGEYDGELAMTPPAPPLSPPPLKAAEGKVGYGRADFLCLAFHLLHHSGKLSGVCRSHCLHLHNVGALQACVPFLALEPKLPKGEGDVC